MATIAHTIPAGVGIGEKTLPTFGFDQSEIEVTRLPAGPTKTRDMSGRNKRQYLITPKVFISSTTNLRAWEIFIAHARLTGNKAWLAETLSDVHRELVCGPITNGTRTTFYVPIITPTAETVFIGTAPPGAVQESGYTLRSVANLVPTDNAASPETDTSAFEVYSAGAIAQETGISADGLSCLKVTPTGSGDGAVHTFASSAPVTVGDSYTALVWVLGGSTYRCVIEWRTSGDGWISNSAGTSAAAADGVWTAYTVAATAPATAAVGRVIIQATVAGTTPFYSDCFQLAPGDYDRWHLPSQAPGLAEFASAPATGKRVTATATGKRVTQVQLTPGFRWQRSARGHAEVRAFTAVEEFDF